MKHLDPTPREHMPHKKGKRQYRRVADRLSNLEPIHGPFVRMYAMIYAIMLQFIEDVRDHDPVLVRDDGTAYENPAVEMAMAMLNDLRECIAMLDVEQKSPSGIDTF